ncbi:non-hydrolyzing UDP-N-acetylglucosamine 2-epimerase [Thermodesulfobacteriota bacterium]
MKSRTQKWILVVGARPNFMKIAPLIRAIDKYNTSSSSLSLTIQYLLVHTGQHYDFNMSDSFFQDLSLPEPDMHLEVGSGTHAEQTGNVLIKFEKALLKERPDLVIVVGDVNSTLACALAAVKLHIPVAHVEAGLRSFDRTMPEEINRLLADAVSDYLFTPSPDADENLKREGIPEDKIFLVGDVMVDSLLFNVAKARKTKILEKLGLRNNSQSVQPFVTLTLHRPSNVDNKEAFLKIVTALKEVSKSIPIIFPAHPRTIKQINAFDFQGYFIKSINAVSPIINYGIYLVNPLGYLEFLNLMIHSIFIMTDSGGVQEESTVLGIPCLTLRDTTERPITITDGTNVLVWNDTQKIIDEALKILDGQGKQGNCPEIWDGKAAERIVDVLAKKL